MSNPIDIIGAELPPQILTVEVSVADAVELARREGAIGAVAATLAPNAMVGMVLAKIRDQVDKGLKEKGANAKMAIVPAPLGSPQPDRLGVGIAVGAGAVGGGYLIWKLISRLLGGK